MNNNENSNNDLNSISLGSVDNIGGTPIPPINPSEIETLNAPVPPLEPMPPVAPIPEPQPTQAGIINEAPVNNIPPVETPNVNNGVINNVNNVPPVAPVPPLEPVTPIYDVNETINSFNSAPVFNDIGTVPPINNIPIPNVPIAEPPREVNNKPKGDGINKLLFVIIIVLALTAVGVGVYIFLGMSNGVTTGVKPKKVSIEVGSSVSTDINDYATFSGINSSTCELDISRITDTSVLNKEYPFTVKCNNETYNGTATIVDTRGPIVNLNNLTLGVNDEVKPEDFIASCTDNSKCSYEFKDAEKVKEYMATAGDYTVEIIAKDEAGNETTVNAKLTVDGAIASIYLVCSKNTDNYVEVTKLGLVDNTFIKSAIRNYEFSLNETNYTAFKNENDSKTEVEYNGIKGTYTLDDANKKVTITKKMSYEELTAEAGAEIPLSVLALKAFYSSKGYSCNFGS